MPLVECVPNVSEGRRSDAIAAMARALTIPGVTLLDRSSDPSHNRTVFTVAGEPDPLQRAILALVGAAVTEIDLQRHTGVHPRIGAVDVIPFVPLRGATMDDCIALARSTAAAIWQQYRLPAYLYENAAASSARHRLSDIRRGGFEQLSSKMIHDEWRPDFGDRAPHPSAGVTVVGARPILIAYNVNLAADRLDVAQRIARTIRESSGGMPYVKAMGVRLEHLGVAQVSMNLTQYKQTGMVAVFDAVRALAAKEGVEVLESEIIGLVPADALPENPSGRLKLAPGSADRVLEVRLAR